MNNGSAPKDQSDAPGETEGAGDAEHGSRTEVNWKTGKGRQPYPNQEPEVAGPPNGGDEFPAGDRGDLSGRNLDQLEEAKRKP